MTNVERPEASGNDPDREVAAPVAPAPSRSHRRDHLRAALRSRDARRQAVVLREVLGPPVALRDPSIDRPT